MVKVSKRKSERLSRQKDTLINKSYEIAKFCDVDVAIFLRIRKTGQLITFKSTFERANRKRLFNEFKECQQCTYPIPVNLLPPDIEAKYKKHS
ncbi:hypothetical protein B0O99DRAFT_487698, partial [Bisporella sp. PMI_857]